MKNQGVVLTIGVSLIMFGIIIWYITGVYLPNQRAQYDQFYANQYAGKYITQRVLTISAENGLYTNTLINEDIFSEGKITAVDVPINFLPKDKNGKLLVYTESEKYEVLNKRTARKLNNGEFIVKNTLIGKEALSEEEKKLQEDRVFRRIVEYTFKNSVAGEVKEGSLVDIMVDYDNGDYDIVIPKIEIKKIIVDTNGGSTSGDMTAILFLDEVQFRDMELAKKVGDLRVRLYEDEDQVASLQTFKYAEMKNLVTALARNNDLKGSISSYGALYYMGFLGDKSDIADKLKARLYYIREQEELKKLQEAAKNKELQASSSNTSTAEVATPTVPTTPVQ